MAKSASMSASAAMQSEQIKQMIEQGLTGARVSVSGDGQHFEAVVVSEAFANKTMVQQHQLVYKTLGDKMRGEIHALSLRTYTPEQWTEQRGGIK